MLQMLLPTIIDITKGVLSKKNIMSKSSIGSYPLIGVSIALMAGEIPPPTTGIEFIDSLMPLISFALGFVLLLKGNVKDAIKSVKGAK
ncbi:hypothetical protein [uncultured Mediterranean phage uvMED]|nr:hypothetical protein [uncultured Mediterranean phage uvMED]